MEVPSDFSGKIKIKVKGDSVSEEKFLLLKLMRNLKKKKKFKAGCY